MKSVIETQQSCILGVYNEMSHVQNSGRANKSTIFISSIFAFGRYIINEISSIVIKLDECSLFVYAPRSSRSTLLPPLQTNLIRAAALPSADNKVFDILHADPILHHREYSRTTLSHFRRIALHDLEICTHGLGKINLVHNQQIRARNTRSTLPRYLVAACNINYVDDEISQLARVVCSEIVTTRFDEEEVGRELLLEGLEGEQVRADVFANSGVRAATGFDSSDTRWGKCFMASEELCVFPVIVGVGC